MPPLLNDIVLFFVIFFLGISISFLLQIIIARVFNPKSFTAQILGVPLLGSVITLALCQLFLAHSFSNPGSYYLAALGANLAASFFFGLYTVSGPISADRSTAGQIIMLLHDKPEGMTTKELLDKFNIDEFLKKRYRELLKAKMIVIHDNRILLNAKGKFIAGMYLILLKGMDLSKKSQFKNYFSKKSPG